MQQIKTQQYIIWLGLAGMISVVMLMLSATSTPAKSPIVPPYFLPWGWTQITGNQIYIECYESEPRKTVSKGLPFAYQRTDTFCADDLTVDGFRTNKYAVIANITSALIIAAGLLYIVTKIPRNQIRS